MSFKVDFEIGDSHEMALDLAVDVRILLEKHDSTHLIGQLFTGAIDKDDFAKVEWWRRHRCFEDMCTIRKALCVGEYKVYCAGANRYKCKKCPVY